MKRTHVIWIAVTVFCTVFSFVGLSAKADGSHSATFQISAEVLGKCEISAQNHTLPKYDPLSGNAVTDKKELLSLKCTKRAGKEIAMGNSQNTCPDGNNRCMKYTDPDATDHYLNYIIYQPDAGGSCTTTEWGPGNPLAIPGARNKDPRNYNICFTLPANQDIPGDATYIDTLEATVNF